MGEGKGRGAKKSRTELKNKIKKKEPTQMNPMAMFIAGLEQTSGEELDTKARGDGGDTYLQANRESSEGRGQKASLSFLFLAKFGRSQDGRGEMPEREGWALDSRGSEGVRGPGGTGTGGLLLTR